ncbi:MAG TPA: hypothetical protein VN200_11275 [Rhodoglobus sp.]|nr:hypothetical protein [Rhodoglobus sp.]
MEDDPYARAAREAILGFVLATNANDFTIAQLTESTTQSRIEEIYESHRAEFEDAEDRIVWAGPLPRSVLAVEEHGDGAGADVVMCDVSSQWYVSADHPEPTVEGVQALPVRLVIVEDGGRLKLDEIRGGSGTCDGEDVALGTFDPIPEVSEGAIRAPLD